MNVNIHHRGPREDTGMDQRKTRPPLRLWVLVNISFVLVLAALFVSSIAAHSQTRQPLTAEKRIHYRIQLSLDYEDRTYEGTERVRWVNHGDHPTSTLFFHLYPNVRMPGYAPPIEKSSSGP